MSGARKKVLWVDDEIEFLRSHIMFLETRGYSVSPVFSGDDAIHLIHENPKAFDIVLLDEQMPGKDGLTTLEEIKEFVPDLPVVMVTKSEEEHLMDEALGKKFFRPVGGHGRGIFGRQASQGKRFVRHVKKFVRCGRGLPGLKG